jgi:hypothetical protein
MMQLHILACSADRKLMMLARNPPLPRFDDGLPDQTILPTPLPTTVRRLFIVQGVVQGHGIASASGVTVSAMDLNAIEVDLVEDLPIDADWTMQDHDDGTVTFTAPSPRPPFVSKERFTFFLWKPADWLAAEDMAKTDRTLAYYLGALLSPDLKGVDLAEPEVQEAIDYILDAILPGNENSDARAARRAKILLG